MTDHQKKAPAVGPPSPQGMTLEALLEAHQAARDAWYSNREAKLAQGAPAPTPSSPLATEGSDAE